MGVATLWGSTPSGEERVGVGAGPVSGWSSGRRRRRMYAAWHARQVRCLGRRIATWQEVQGRKSGEGSTWNVVPQKQGEGQRGRRDAPNRRGKIGVAGALLRALALADEGVEKKIAVDRKKGSLAGYRMRPLSLAFVRHREARSSSVRM